MVVSREIGGRNVDSQRTDPEVASPTPIFLHSHFAAEEYPKEALSTAIQDLLMTFECLGLAIWHVYSFPPSDYDPNQNPEAPKLSGRLPLIYAFRDAVGIKDMIDDWNHTMLLGTRFEGRRLNEEETWERNLEDAGQGGRLRRSLERVRSDEPGAEGRWVLERSGRYYDSAVVSDQASPGDPESGTQELLHAGVNFPDPSASSEREIESLYSQARALLFGDYNYPVLGGPAAPNVAILRRNAAQVGYQIEGEDHGYFAGYEVRDPTPSQVERGEGARLGAANQESGRSRSTSREPQIRVIDDDEDSDNDDQAGRGDVPLLGNKKRGKKGKGKGKDQLLQQPKAASPQPRTSIEGNDKSPIMSPVDPEDVKNAMLLDDNEDDEE